MLEHAEVSPSINPAEENPFTQFVTPKKFAELTGIPFKTVRWWVKNRQNTDFGQCVTKVGNRFAIDTVEARKWFEKHKGE